VIRPPARTQHSAVISGDTMVVFGGLDASGTALGDVWRFIRSQNRWRRSRRAVAGRVRATANTAVLVPGRTNAPWPDNVPEMLVLGGRDAAHALADSTVWALALPRAGTRSGARSMAAPVRRRATGQAAVLDNFRQRPGEPWPPDACTLFGGEAQRDAARRLVLRPTTPSRAGPSRGVGARSRPAEHLGGALAAPDGARFPVRSAARYSAAT